MGVMVVACYRPKPGKDKELEQLTSEHVDILRAQGLATSRRPIAGRAQDGTVVEVFEWVSQDAIDRAHENPEVLKLWQRYGEVCDYVKLADVPESSQMWASFVPLN